ncbi:hypothetical protein ACET3Z_019313 [Daucus carota]
MLLRETPFFTVADRLTRISLPFIKVSKISIHHKLDYQGSCVMAQKLGLVMFWVFELDKKNNFNCRMNFMVLKISRYT